jgi:hypothetical protein
VDNVLEQAAPLNLGIDTVGRLFRPEKYRLISADGYGILKRNFINISTIVNIVSFNMRTYEWHMQNPQEEVGLIYLVRDLPAHLSSMSAS